MQTSVEDDAVTKWDDLELSSELLRGVYAYGFEKPSPIQSRAIRPILLGRDVLAQAQSGTGKTGCFAVASLSIVDPKMPGAQVLILSPTRELAQQTSRVTASLGQFISGIRTQTLVGGASVREDSNNLRKARPQILLGCPW